MTQSLEEKEAARFFRTQYADFEKARLSTGGGPSYFFAVGEFSIRLLFAGPALLQALTPALGHLSTAPVDSPDLTILCWDTETTGIPLSARPWKNRLTEDSTDIFHFRSGGFQVLFNCGSGVLSALDFGARTALYWHQSASELPPQEKAAPFRALLQWALGTQGRAFIHAAAVSTAGRGLLLAGREKSGKSTTSFLCLLHGMDFAGDDYVFVAGQEKYQVHSLYGSMKLDPRFTLQIPGLENPLAGSARKNGEKAIIALNRSFPERMSRGFPLDAIFLPAVKGSGTSVISRASAGWALTKIAPSTLALLAGEKKESFDFLAELVRRVPCFSLELGRDFGDIPKRIGDTISGLG